MMPWTLIHRRDDGSFVIERNGIPYHVMASDPLFSEVSAAADGVTLPDEPSPPIPTIAELVETTRRHVHAEARRRRDLLAPNYPQHEIDTWDQQRREAVAYKADPMADVPLLTAMAMARGWTVVDLAARVLVKAAAFAQAGGAILGAQQALEDQIQIVLSDLAAVTITEAQARTQLAAIDPTDPTAWP